MNNIYEEALVNQRYPVMQNGVDVNSFTFLSPYVTRSVGGLVVKATGKPTDLLLGIPRRHFSFFSTTVHSIEG